MSDKNNSTRLGDRAQEMLMLDILDGMHEFFIQAAYHGSVANSFEILPAEEDGHLPANACPSEEPGSAKIISFNEARVRRMIKGETKDKKIAGSRS